MPRPSPFRQGVDAPVRLNGHHRYGPRGTLTRLLLELLDAGYPKGVDTLTLVNTIAARLGVSFATMQERNKCRNRLCPDADFWGVEQ